MNMYMHISIINVRVCAFAYLPLCGYVRVYMYVYMTICMDIRIIYYIRICI